MKNYQNTEIPDFEIFNRTARIYWNKTEEQKDDQLVYSSEYIEFDISENRESLINKIINSRYTVDKELAVINNNGEEYREYLQFRELAKILVDNWLVYSGQQANITVKVPQTITMRQARLALLNVGLLDQVNNAISSISDEISRRKAEIDWEYATNVERNWPWVIQLAPILGLTDNQLDNLFIEASKL